MMQRIEFDDRGFREAAYEQRLHHGLDGETGRWRRSVRFVDQKTDEHTVAILTLRAIRGTCRGRSDCAKN
eukprot:6141708-Pleurochrysis_carterae.AAC.1